MPVKKTETLILSCLWDLKVSLRLRRRTPITRWIPMWVQASPCYLFNISISNTRFRARAKSEH